MYCRLKFTSGAYHFNTLVSSKSLSQWIKEVLEGTITTAQLPSTHFDLSNCVKEGSLPSDVTVQYLVYNGASSTPQWQNNYLQFTKAHSQNSNFVNLFRIYQNSYLNLSFNPRMLSANGTNEVPAAMNSNQYWYNTTNSAYMTHGLSEVEFQFFISSHWVIWSTLDASGRGGTAGIFDVESTGSDVWARSLNSLYSPQIFITSHGALWPSSATQRVSEGTGRFQLGIYSNLMYNGDNSFTNRGAIVYGVHSASEGNTNPMIYPDPGSAFYSTRDNIGDTQNYMIPVYMHGGYNLSTTVPTGRSILTGRIPFLWRTSDNAGQTGQKATVSGTEYRFVRLHPCGIYSSTNINAATYMVPTTIGGV